MHMNEKPDWNNPISSNYFLDSYCQCSDALEMSNNEDTLTNDVLQLIFKSHSDTNIFTKTEHGTCLSDVVFVTFHSHTYT